MSLPTRRNAVRSLRHLHMKLPSLYPAIDTNAHTFGLPYCSGFYGVRYVCLLHIIRHRSGHHKAGTIFNSLIWWYEWFAHAAFPLHNAQTAFESFISFFAVCFEWNYWCGEWNVGYTQQTSTAIVVATFRQFKYPFVHISEQIQYISYVYETREKIVLVENKVSKNRRCRLAFPFICKNAFALINLLNFMLDTFLKVLGFYYYQTIDFEFRASK